MTTRNQSDECKMNLVVSLKAGVANTCAVVQKHPDSKIEFTHGNGMTAEIQADLVTNIKKATDFILAAISEAEKIIGCKIDSVIKGVSGQNINIWNCSGVTAIKDIKVSNEDISRTLDAAKANIPSSCEILHILQQEFIVDEQGGIADPMGMTGIRLEVRAYLVTSSQTV